MKRYSIWVILVLALSVGTPYAQQKIRSDQALGSVGKTVRVCGLVKNTLYDQNHARKVTILNLDRAYPNHVFTIVINEKDRPKFANPPEVYYRDKRVCVSGVVSKFDGRATMLVQNAEQLKLDK